MVGANCRGIFQTVAMRGCLSIGLVRVQRHVWLEMGNDDTRTYPGSEPSLPEVKPLRPAYSLLRAHSGYNAP
jgi:hypothetical protein